MTDTNRRDFIKNLAVGASALAVGSVIGKDFAEGSVARVVDPVKAGLQAQRDSRALDTFTPPEALNDGEMRISILGSNYIACIGQAANSIFVELGNANRDTFVFDCGSGVMAKYVAMGVPFSKMANVFLTHLHADHMSDLIYIYCFGPSVDRKTDMHVYGPSGPNGRQGTKAFCRALHALTRWHADSFSFLTTGLTNGQDGYHLVAHQLPYREVATAYESGDVKITHFPAIHARSGAISYKLEWGGPGDISARYSGPYTLGLDMMVFNISMDKAQPIQQRMAMGQEYGWFVAEKSYPPDQLAPARFSSPTAQLSKYLLDQALDESLWT